MSENVVTLMEKRDKKKALEGAVADRKNYGKGSVMKLGDPNVEMRRFRLVRWGWTARH